MTSSTDIAWDADGKTRLLQGALHCVADHGIAGASVRRIAAYAGVTPGLVRHHFGTKTALLSDCYRSLNELALARMSHSERSEGRTLDADLTQAIKAFFPEDLRDVREMRVLVAFWGAVLTTPEFAQVQAETNRKFRRHLIRMIRFHTGDLPDLPGLADGIIAITDGLWLECCLNPTRMTPEHAIARAHDFCLWALRGLQKTDV